ncbi:MAG TPA: DUF2752 domain-containing protein [Blastocatellia bacterium]|nr:DUF2752 domain-containing protein [Blastocatellia bacterium]
MESSHKNDNRYRLEEMVGLTFLTGLIIGAFFYDPSNGPSFPVCLFHHWTGLPCPACGMTRSVCAFMKGRWEEAVYFHPLGPMAALILVGSWTKGIISICISDRGSRPARRLRSIVERMDEFFRHPYVVRFGLTLLVIMWIIRVAWLGWRDPMPHPMRLPFSW